MELRKYLDTLPRGEIANFALDIGITPVYLSQLASRQNGRVPSPGLALAIDRFTNGIVSRADLRPDDYWRIWPDLGDPVRVNQKKERRI